MSHRYRLVSALTVLVLILGLSVADAFPFPIVYAVSPTVVQTAQNGNTSVFTIAKAFTSNPTINNLIIVVANYCCAAFGTFSVTDSIGNTFTQITSVTITSPGNFYTAIWIAKNKATSADTVTFSTTNNVGAPSMSLVIYEVSGSTIGYIDSTGSSTGSNCSPCSVTSYSIPANPLTIVGAYSNAAGAGSWTNSGAGWTSVLPSIATNSFSEYSTSVTGANTVPITWSNPLNGWVELAVTFNVQAPSDNNVINNAGAGFQINNNVAGATCTLPYVFSGNAVILVLAGIGVGNKISTTTDSLTDVYTIKFAVNNGGASNAILNITGTTATKDAVNLAITTSVNGVGGHGAFSMSCYQIQTSNGGFTVVNYNGSTLDTAPHQLQCNGVNSTACNLPVSGTAAGHFSGNLCIGISNNCLNEGIYSMSGTGTNMCPTLLTFHTAVTDGIVPKNIAGAGDSHAANSCGVDPAATSNHQIMVDNYGENGGFMTGTFPSQYNALDNMTTGNILGGSGVGDIMGVFDIAGGATTTVTSTITGWVFPNFSNCQGAGSPQCGTSVNWIFGLLILLLPVALIDTTFIEVSDNIDRNILVFLTLFGLVIGAILGAMFQFLPLAVPFGFVLIFGLYLWRGRG